MMNAIVQLIRNFLCCVKDCKFIPNSFIHLPIPVVLKSKFNYNVNIPSPLHLTTPLEFMICLSQFYAHYTTTKSGYQLIQSGYAKLKQIKYLMNARGTTPRKGNSNVDAEKIVDDMLLKEKNDAIKDIIIGACLLPIGISFFWLFANSLHVTSTDWIGGVPGLILALTIMEIALIPLLYYMIKDANKKTAESSKMRQIARGSVKEIHDLRIDGTTFNLLVSYEPFWSKDQKHWAKYADDNTIQQQFDKEIDFIDSKLKEIKKLDDKEKFQNIVSHLEVDSANANLQGWREYIYFLLNFLAFYGYLMGIIVYIWNDEANQPLYISRIKFWMTNPDADWRGNFLGDLMWTVEPVVILASPSFFGLFLPTEKVKKE